MPADGKAKSAKTNFLKLDSCNAGDWSANRKLFFLLGLRPLLAPLMHVKLRRIRDRFDESAFPATTLVIEESHEPAHSPIVPRSIRLKNPVFFVKTLSDERLGTLAKLYASASRVRWAGVCVLFEKGSPFVSGPSTR